MQKSLSIIITDTKRSFEYFNEIKKINFSLDTIIFYSKKNKINLLKKLKNYKFKKKILIFKTNDINQKEIVNKIKKIKSNYILFSGYNAEIIKDREILKKNIIHCHPGLIPNYRGSTVFYYSLIINNSINVSIFRMSNIIDIGEVIYSKKFFMPKKTMELEKNFDNKIRANTLINFLTSNKSQNKKIKKIKKINRISNFYYIAHPIIRNIVHNPRHYLKLIGV